MNRSQDEIDKGVAVNQTGEKERNVLEDPDFKEILSRLGINELRSFISRLLADRMTQLIPELRQKANEDMNRAKEDLKQHRRFDHTDADKDDLISKLVERSMERIRTNLHGLSTNVVIDTEGTGAQMNTIIKEGF